MKKITIIAFFCIISIFSWAVYPAQYNNIDIIEIGCTDWESANTNNKTVAGRNVNYIYTSPDSLSGTDIYFTIAVYGTASYYDSGVRFYFRSGSTGVITSVVPVDYLPKQVLNKAADNVPIATAYFKKISLSTIRNLLNNDTSGSFRVEVDAVSGDIGSNLTYIVSDETLIKVKNPSTGFNLSINSENGLVPVLSWPPSTLYEPRYVVYRSPNNDFTNRSPINSSSLTDTTYIDREILPSGYTFYYKIVAFSTTDPNPDNRIPTATVTFTPKLNAPKITISQIGVSINKFPKIQWNEITGVTKYEIYRTIELGQEELIKSVSSNSFTDFEYIPGKKYKYRAKALSGSEKSDFSNQKEILIKNY